MRLTSLIAALFLALRATAVGADKFNIAPLAPISPRLIAAPAPISAPQALRPLQTLIPKAVAGPAAAIAAPPSALQSILAHGGHAARAAGHENISDSRRETENNFILSAGLGPGGGGQGGVSAESGDNHRELVLDNGMHIQLVRRPERFSANIMVAYAVGGRDEPQGETGYTHFVEHLMFQGTKNIRNWFGMIGAMGAHTNARTHRDYTIYTQTLPVNLLETGIGLEAERMAHLDVTPEKVEREKGVILEEKAGRDNAPYAAGQDALTRLQFSNPRNQSDVMGSEADIRAATAEKLGRYIDTYYGPRNAKVVISADMDLDRLEKIARGRFGALAARGKTAPKDLFEPEQTAERRGESSDPYATAPAALFSWAAPRHGGSEYYAAGLTASLLLERLHKRLVLEKKTAAAVSIGYPYLEGEPAAVTGSIVQGPGLSFEEALDALDAERAALERGEFSDEELAALKFRQASEASTQLHDSGNAELLAIAAARGLDFAALERDVESWRKVTRDQIRLAAKKFFSKNRRNAVAVRPGRQAAQASAEVHGHRPRVDETPTPRETALLEEIARTRWNEAEFVAPRVFYLENGLKVIVVPDGKAKTIYAKLAFRMGEAAWDSDFREKLPFAAGLMRFKTRDHSEVELNQRLQSLRATVDLAQKWDHIVFDANAPSGAAAPLLALLAEMVLRPALWTEADMKPWKEWWRQNLKYSQSDPSYASTNQAVRDLLGDHPSARAMTPEAIDALSPERFAEILRRHFAPNNAVLVVAGDIGAKAAASLPGNLEKLFGGWKPSELSARAGPRANVRPQKEIALIDRPGAEQNFIRFSAIGEAGQSQNLPDFFPLIVANQIFGDGYGSRLFQVVRQSLGLAYSAFSEVITDPVLALWTFGASTRPEKTSAALKALLEQAEGMRARAPSGIELGAAKNSLIGPFLMSLDYIGNIADHYLGFELFGLPLDSMRKYTARVSQVTAEQVRELSARLLDPEKLAITVVGEADRIRRELSSFRAVSEYDKDGKPVKRSWLDRLSS